MNDTISRQAAIEAVERNAYRHTYIDQIVDIIKGLPSAQPDAIPLEWIAKHLEWLDNCDNDFAQLATVAIRAMVEIWKRDKTQ